MRLSALALSILGIAVTGCATTPAAMREEPLAKKPVARQEIRDVAVPAGFRYDKRSSYVYAGAFRHSALAYTGSGEASIDGVLGFYKDHMARDGWTLTWQYGTPDAPKLLFRKGFDECRVEVFRAAGETIDGAPVTRIYVTITPSGG